MNRLAALLVPALLLAAPVAAKPLGCLTAKEAQAEQNVRHGVRLREGAWRCEALGLADGTKAAWQALDDAFGAQFVAEGELRRRAFGREFDSDGEAELTRWNGRIISHFRHRPLSEAYCRHLGQQLADAGQRGWRAFQKQAAREAPEVELDQKVCR